jgi:hypothetical protein
MVKSQQSKANSQQPTIFIWKYLLNAAVNVGGILKRQVNYWKNILDALANCLVRRMSG